MKSRTERDHCENVAHEVFLVVAQGGPPMPALQQSHLQRTLASVVARERADAVAVALHADRELAMEVPSRWERVLDTAIGRLREARIEIAEVKARVAELEAELNNPQTTDFVQAVRTEAAHQRTRWPSAHDSGKAPEDWYWLLGYLGGKALREDGDEKRLHRIIAAAAACANWYLHASGADKRMRPGIKPPSGGESSGA